MNQTKELYHIHFGGEYPVCLSWGCEVIASALEASDETTP